MRRNSGLKRRIVYWLVAYAVLLSVVVSIAGYVVHERVERLAWKSLLRSELDYFRQRAETSPGYRWHDTDTLRMFGGGGAPPLPASLDKLAPGLHDDMSLDGKPSVVWLDQIGRARVALALDLTEFEGMEDAITTSVVLITIGMILLLGLLVMWGLSRVIEPLTAMARQVEALRPESPGQRVTVEAASSSELVLIAEAFSDYLQRNDRFVERERAFIDITSHELRTPIAVIAGATELALDQPGLPASARSHLLRIDRTARSVEQLFSLLLILARDPARLAAISDRFSLDQLLPEIVEDHRHLTRGKDLSLVLGSLPACEIVAPVIIVQAAIGNLLRNAIEHSDSGEIRIWLHADATVVIEDPGQGMSPEEISEIYARVARGGGRDGGGIGLDLISRLCEHLGWSLAFASAVGRGTTTRLRLSRQPVETATAN